MKMPKIKINLKHFFFLAVNKNRFDSTGQCDDVCMERLYVLYHVGLVLHTACGHTLVLIHTAFRDGDTFAVRVHPVTRVTESGVFTGS